MDGLQLVREGGREIYYVYIGGLISCMGVKREDKLRALRIEIREGILLTSEIYDLNKKGLQQTAGTGGKKHLTNIRDMYI